MTLMRRLGQIYVPASTLTPRERELLEYLATFPPGAVGPRQRDMPGYERSREAITRRLKRLEEAGYVVRVRPNDKTQGARAIEISDAGRARLASL